MTEEELVIRQKVWEALSNFYLDTELEETDYACILKVFRETKFTLDELKEIDLYEVFPALQINLSDIAGEWAGFDSDWLNAKCLNNLKKRKNKIFVITTQVKNKIHYWMRKNHWEKIEILLKSNT